MEFLDKNACDKKIFILIIIFVEFCTFIRVILTMLKTREIRKVTLHAWNSRRELEREEGSWQMWSYHIILSWQNEIAQSTNRSPQKNKDGQNLPTRHVLYMVYNSRRSSKWGIWSGALELWLELQNAPKAPANSNEAAWCSNQVHGAQEGPDVARTLVHSFQDSLHSPFCPSAAIKYSQYLATGKRTHTHSAPGSLQHIP